jgi:hypothetical protein
LYKLAQASKAAAQREALLRFARDEGFEIVTEFVEV